jgi:hypothetical protein
MDFTIFPFVMIAFCVVMVVMMYRMGVCMAGIGRCCGAGKWDAVD